MSTYNQRKLDRAHALMAATSPEERAAIRAEGKADAEAERLARVAAAR